MRPEIDEIARKLVAECAPEKIILFGSYAYGQPDEDSDLDFLVVMDTDLPPLERNLTVRRTIGPQHVPIDIFVL
ncbi:MAG: hypothetical protein AMS14_10915, partial [Planctomycetes bacterium DG_20]